MYIFEIVIKSYNQPGYKSWKLKTFGVYLKYIRKEYTVVKFFKDILYIIYSSYLEFLDI